MEGDTEQGTFKYQHRARALGLGHGEWKETWVPTWPLLLCGLGQTHFLSEPQFSNICQSSVVDHMLAKVFLSPNPLVTVGPRVTL